MSKSAKIELTDSPRIPYAAEVSAAGRAAATPGMRADAVKKGSTRVVEVDITKGLLVVCMVIYHTLNYSTQRQLGFRYLAFLPPSFILITGFLISSVYLARPDRSLRSVHGRLITRGIKLLLLFTVLNIFVQKFFSHALRGAVPGLRVFWTFWFDIYLTGNVRMGVFEVLLPIAYLLICAPFLLIIDGLHRAVLPVLCVVAVGALVFAEMQGEAWFNLELLSAGVLGMVIGKLPWSTLQRAKGLWLPLGCAYGVYFWYTLRAGQGYVPQLVGAVLAVALFYSVSPMFALLPPVSGLLQILGRYSLIAYIGQILILQGVSRVTGHPEPGSPRLLALFLITLFSTLVLALGTDWMRKRSSACDAAYKVVFG